MRVFAERDAKLAAARQERERQRAETIRQAERERDSSACYTENTWPEDRALLGEQLERRVRPKREERGDLSVASTFPCNFVFGLIRKTPRTPWKKIQQGFNHRASQ